MIDTLFIVAQLIAFAGWVPLFALPWVGRRPALLWARGAAALLCLLYLAFFLPSLGAIPRDEGYTLAAVAGAFETRELLLAGWIHYLVLDLWVGSWEAEHAPSAGVPHAALLACLFATMMIGPLGLLLYLGVAASARRRAAPGAD
jgi:hypothetical protein